MSLYEITTESGSVYRLDTLNKTMKRKPGDDAGELDYDEKPFAYEELLDELTIGNPLRAVWDDKGRKRIRTSTPMTCIERM